MTGRGQGPRVVLVTGKGGVGKTVVSTSLALHYAASGLRTVLVETAGATNVSALFGRVGGGYALTSLRPNLSTLSLTPEAAIEDYVVQQIRFRRLYTMVFKNRVMGPFIDAVPGLHDAVQLGKVFDLSRERRGSELAWDRVVVDAPATGHGLTMIGSARSMMDLTRAGPLYEGVKQVQQVIGDPRHTAVLLVSLAESLPVNETVELWERLGESRGLLRGVVLNLCQRSPIETADWSSENGVIDAAPNAAALRALVERRLARVAQQASAAARLGAATGAPVRQLSDLRAEQGGLLARPWAEADLLRLAAQLDAPGLQL